MKTLGLLLVSSFLHIMLLAQGMNTLELLEKSIQYHDPNGNWEQVALALHFEETRPDGSIRYTAVQIDIAKEFFAVNQKNGTDEVIRTIEKGKCTHQLNGSSTISEEDTKRLRLTCERTAFMRNYYTYLWGLPMKLKDPGTLLDATASLDTFDGKKAYKMRVRYDAAVGSDVWYFYFDTTTFALIGYRFYHDESKNDGEYILLSGETSINGMRLPKVRKWYTHQADKFLGTDTLVRGQ